MQNWLAEPRNEGFTEQEVRDTLDLSWGRSPKVRHGVDVRTATDAPSVGETLRVETGEVTWSYRPPDQVTGQSTAAASVRRQASITVVGPTSVPLASRRFRLWTEWLSPTGRWVRFHLGVFIPANPGAADDGMVVRHTLSLADKTFRYNNHFLEDTLVVEAGAAAVAWVKSDLTTRFGETSFAMAASSVVLEEDMVFEAGESMLEVYNALLQAAAFDDLTTDENGRPSSQPLATIAEKGSEHTYAAGAGKIMRAGQVEPLLPTLPNVVRFVARQGFVLLEEGSGIRTVVNQSTGPASVGQRGEEVVLRVEVDAEGQDELDAIAAADAQRYFAGGGLRFSGNVALNPRHGDRDVITLLKPSLDLDGNWIVTSWKYPLMPITDEGSVLMPITCEKKV